MAMLPDKQKLSYIEPIDPELPPRAYPPIVACDPDEEPPSYQPDFCR